MDNLENVLNQLRSKIVEHTTLVHTSQHLESLKKQLDVAQNERAALHQKLKKEEQDVEALENRSVKKLFYKVLGNADQQLDKERQEYLNMSLQYNNAQDAVELLTFEISVLEGKTKQLALVEEQVNQLKKLREREILTYDLESPVKAALTKNLLLTDDLINSRHEHLEAMEQGKLCLREVSVIYDHLVKARDWGQWSHQQSSARFKYHGIDRARRHLPRAQMSLNKFIKELADINLSDDRLLLRLADVGKFNMLFFDNIITDWIVHQKLQQSISSIKGTLNVIDGALIHVDKELVTHDAKYRELTLQKDEILMQD